MDAILSVDVDPDTAVAILFQRENPRGPSQELWRHTYGCRSWLRLTRNTVTHDLAEVVAWPPA